MRSTSLTCLGHYCPLHCGGLAGPAGMLWKRDALQQQRCANSGCSDLPAWSHRVPQHLIPSGLGDLCSLAA